MDLTSSTSDKKSILLVDDDAFLLDMYSLKFSQSGYLIHAASNAHEALNLLRKPMNVFDALVVDILMPEMDGFDLIKHINDEKLAENSKIIILSNLGTEEDIRRGKELGVAGYIVKASATPSEVVETVTNIISK